MEPDTSVMMVWPMAAMEAQALGWSEIEPAHLLCAALKFAELDMDDLERLGEAAGNVGELRQRHRDLRERLDEPWGIAVPDISTPLRRALRRRGDGESNPHPGGMIHRSATAREVFRAAQKIAERDGRQRFDLADLAGVILRDPDEWVRRGLDQHKILSASQLSQRDQAIEKWADLFVPVTPSGTPDSEEKQRILADPAVRVLADTFTKPTPRSCLMIHGPDRTAHDVLTDLLNRPSDKKLPKIVRVDSRALLERLSEDPSFSASSFLEFLTDEANQKTVWFFDSLHRYLAEELTPSAFRLRFVQWLKQTDSRFLFAIPKSQYNKQAEQHTDWKDTFQLIWIHGPSQSAVMEL
ncbi:MAG: hypothetical protein WBC05_18815 [Sedimentisphaerales bacterium]